MPCDKLITSLFLFGWLAFTQCKTGTRVEEQSDSGTTGAELPTNHSADEIVFLPDTLTVTQTVRPKVELRIGPGSEFELLDQTLSINTGVVILESKDIWQKVFVPLQRVTGWTHVKSLAQPRGNVEPMPIPLNRLPIVTAVRSINTVNSFPENESKIFEIPKGQVMVQLRRSHGKTLVFLKEDNALVWLAPEDIQ